MSRRWVIPLLVAAAAGVLAGLTRSAHASYPGTNDAIAFEQVYAAATFGAVSSYDPAAKTVTPVIASPSDRHDVVWSPEGHRLAWAQEDTGGIGIRDDDGTIRVVAVGTQAQSPQWTPDGSHLLFSCAFGDLCSIADDGTDFRRVATIDTGPWNAPALSPDGKRLAILADGSIAVTSIGGGSLHVIATPSATNCAENRISWSPDGSRVAYCADYKLWTANTDGSGTRLLATDAWGSPAWSPDGKQIVYPAVSGSVTQPALAVVAANGSGGPVYLRDAAGNFVYGGMPDWRRTPTPYTPPTPSTSTATTPTTTTTAPPANAAPAIRSFGATTHDGRLAVALTVCDDSPGRLVADVRANTISHTWSFAGANGCVSSTRAWRAPPALRLLVRVRDAAGAWSRTIHVVVRETR